MMYVQHVRKTTVVSKFAGPTGAIICPECGLAVKRLYSTDKIIFALCDDHRFLSPSPNTHDTHVVAPLQIAA